jgi:hypothetical protein
VNSAGSRGNRIGGNWFGVEVFYFLFGGGRRRRNGREKAWSEIAFGEVAYK